MTVSKARSTFFSVMITRECRVLAFEGFSIIIHPATMVSTSRLCRFRLRTLPCQYPRSPSTTGRRFASTTNEWDGRHGDEHVLNRNDELDVHSSASKSGKRERAEESHSSSAATEKDTRNDNEQAKKDHPEAPGPVIGMNSGKIL